MAKAGSHVHLTESGRPFFANHLQRLQHIAKYIPNWAICLFIGAIALSFNLYRISEPDMWFDEILSVERATQTLGTLWKIVTTTQPNMALYYYFLHGWLRAAQLLGFLPTEFVVRLPSAIFSALAAIVIFLLGRRYLGLISALVATGLYVLSPLQLMYAQETRSYSMQLLLLCLSWYALLNAITTPAQQRRWLIVYVTTATLAVYAHLFSLLMLFSQLVALAGLFFLENPWRTQVRQQAKALGISLGSLGILITPMLYASRIGGKTSWIPVPGLNDIPHLFLVFSGRNYVYLFVLVGLCMIGILFTFLALRTRGQNLLRNFRLLGQPDQAAFTRYQTLWTVGLVLLCWLFVPIIASYLISQGETRLFLDRYLVSVLPAFYLLIGLGVIVLRWRSVQLALAACVLIAALFMVPGYYASAQVEEWATAAQWIQQRFQNEDRLICYDNVQGCQVSLEYYLSITPGNAYFTDDAPGAFPWVTYDTTNQPGNTDEATNITKLQAYASQHPRIFYITARLSSDQAVARVQAAQKFLDSNYRLIGQFSNDTVSIHLYDTTSEKP